MVRHIRHNEIDRQRWDDCINRSVQRFPYACSWWLDVVCPAWEALVQDDYLAVMPLTGGRKYGINYLYQPYLTQQLGVFSPELVTQEETNLFLKAIPESFLFIDIQFNPQSNPSCYGYSYSIRKNFVLDLSKSYTSLSACYHRNCRRNIQKALNARYKVKEGPGPAAFVRFVERNLEQKLSFTDKKLFTVMEKACLSSRDNQTGEILGVYSPSGNLTAAAWFVHGTGRCLFTVCASTPEGRHNQAMYLLVDHKIKTLAGSGLILDFMGSDLSGVAYFNSGFGAISTNYLRVKSNHLPWPLRLIKK